MKKYKYLAVIIILIVLIIAEYHYIKRDINWNTRNILDGSYPMNSQIAVIDTVHHEIHGVDSKEGYLAYGPYISLKPGRYTVQFALLIPEVKRDGGQNEAVGYCDVNINGYLEYNRKIELRSKDFTGGNVKLINLEFTVPPGNPQLEFRVYKNKVAALALTGLQLRPALKEILFTKGSKWMKFNMILAASLMLVIGSSLLVFLFRKVFKTKYKLKIAVFIIFLVFIEVWWFRQDLLLHIFPGTIMSTQIGVIDTQHGEIRGVGAKNGYLAFGPYLPLPAIYKIKLNNFNPQDDPEREIGIADINIVGFPEKGVTKAIKIGDFNCHNMAKMVARFQVPTGNPRIECRVFQYGGNDLSIKAIKIHTTDYIKKYYKVHLDFIGLAVLAAIVFI
jgi:hypothetical protein